MKFLPLHLHLFHKAVEFENIQGYDDIKDLIRRALDSYENYNLLLCGPPASAKTLFLLGILESRKGVFFDGSHLGCARRRATPNNLYRRTRQDASNIPEPTLELYGVW